MTTSDVIIVAVTVLDFIPRAGLPIGRGVVQALDEGGVGGQGKCPAPSHLMTLSVVQALPGAGRAQGARREGHRVAPAAWGMNIAAAALQMRREGAADQRELMNDSAELRERELMAFAPPARGTVTVSGGVRSHLAGDA
ncbi:hypothetical protein ACWC2H_05620 [Streptomyces sp. 900105755]